MWNFRLKFLWITFSLACLLSGSFIYLAYRPTNLRMFSWIEILGIEKYIINLRTTVKGIPLNDFFINNLPNGLWVMSLTILLLIIWENNYNRIFKIYFSILSLLVILPEIFQLFNIISGTFDIIDLIVNLCCLIIPSFLVGLHKRRSIFFFKQIGG